MALIGYLLILKYGWFGTSAALGGSVPYSIRIDNIGHASPVNKHPFQLVLRECDAQVICDETNASKDFLEWLWKGTLVFPDDFPKRTYEMFLRLADKNEYLIRPQLEGEWNTHFAGIQYMSLPSAPHLIFQNLWLPSCSNMWLPLLWNFFLCRWKWPT